MQLLPRREFVEASQGIDPIDDYWSPAVFKGFIPKVVDRLFGNGIGAVPDEQVFAKALPLQKLPGFDTEAPAMPGVDSDMLAEKIIMVVGRAELTPIGVKTDDTNTLELVFTPQGDGTVPWVSSRIGGIGRAYSFEAEHGDLCATERYFEAISQILSTGRTELAPEGWPRIWLRWPLATAPLAVRQSPSSCSVPSRLQWPCPTMNSSGAPPWVQARGRRGARHARPQARSVDLRVSC